MLLGRNLLLALSGDAVKRQESEMLRTEYDTGDTLLRLHWREREKKNVLIGSFRI